MTQTQDAADTAAVEPLEPSPPAVPSRGADADEREALTLGEGARLLAPSLRPYRATIVVAVVLSLVAAATSLAQPLLVRQVVSQVQDSRPITALAGLLVALLVVSTVLGGVRQFLLERAGEGVVLSVRENVVRRLSRMTVAERDARLSGDLLSRVGSDTTALASVVTSGLFESVGVALTAIGALAVMAYLDVVLLGVTVAAVAVGLGVGIAASRRLRALELTTQRRVGAMSAAVARMLSALRTIRASGATEREMVDVVGAARQARDASVAAARVRAVIAPVTGLAVQAAFIAVLGVGGYRVASGALSVGSLVAFVLLLFTLVLPLGQLLRVWTVLQAGLAALTRIDEVLGVAVEQDAVPAAVAVPAATGAPLLAFDRVAFSYGDGTPALAEVTFSVPAGTRTAVVGPSGAGKSTLLSLVERFHDVDAGAVRLGGVDVRQMPRAGLRARLGYVEQDAPVLAGTLRSNLLLAAPRATDEQLAAVLHDVALDELLTRSADGLDAAVGEGGVLLSGGQRQRLAIARSLLSAPELLLLDEPTASLDARNEALLREVLSRAADSRTLVVVAHRLSTVVDSDQIVVLDAGKVVATGTHAELLEVSPLYRELATSQLLV